MPTRQEVVAAARSWIGVRWQHQGRTRHGIDCVGLVVVVCRELGISDYDSMAYGRDPDARKFLGHFSAGGATRINPRDVQDGDLIAFEQAGFPCHCGLASTRYGARYVVHATLARRMVWEEQMHADAPIVAAYQLPGVA